MSDTKKIETEKQSKELPPEKTPNPEHIQKEIDKKSFCSVSTLTKTNTLKAPYPIRLTYEQLINKFETQLVNI